MPISPMSTTPRIIWTSLEICSPWPSSAMKISWNGYTPSKLVDASSLHLPTSKKKRNEFRVRAWARETESCRWLRSYSCGPAPGKYRRSSGGLPDQLSFDVFWLEWRIHLSWPEFELWGDDWMWITEKWPQDRGRVRLQHDRLALVFGESFRLIRMVQSDVHRDCTFSHIFWRNRHAGICFADWFSSTKLATIYTCKYSNSTNLDCVCSQGYCSASFRAIPKLDIYAPVIGSQPDCKYSRE